MWFGRFVHADICNVDLGFMATDYINFLQSPGTEGQNMRPNRLNTVLFVNAIIAFSENIFLVIVAFFENTTIEYSSESLCVCLCLCACVFAR